MFLINSRFKHCQSLFQLLCPFLRCSFTALLFTEAIWKAAFWQVVPYWEQKNLAGISLIATLESLWPPGTCRVRRYVPRSLCRSFGRGEVTPALLQGLVWWLFCSWLCSLSTRVHCLAAATRPSRVFTLVRVHCNGVPLILGMKTGISVAFSGSSFTPHCN